MEWELKHRIISSTNAISVLDMESLSEEMVNDKQRKVMLPPFSLCKSNSALSLGFAISLAFPPSCRLHTSTLLTLGGTLGNPEGHNLDNGLLSVEVAGASFPHNLDQYSLDQSR